MKFGRAYIAGWVSMIVAWAFILTIQPWPAVVFGAIACGCWLASIKKFRGSK
jgi:hypothetical protein